MEFTDKTLHYIIIGILVIVMILLTVHIFQMRKENYADVVPLVTNASNPLGTIDQVANIAGQSYGAQGVVADQRNSYNQVMNTQYYGNPTGDFVKGDNLVGDNNVTA